uniref:Immunoglobulin superfamily 3 n=1 Tax=Eptatretus burgeri TaxID=7764 RepID=Q1T774_EPTBU|nr:immunoglobulin superfamily 3 [Eptatretus burgeri]
MFKLIRDVLVILFFSLFFTSICGLKVESPSEVGFVDGKNVSLPCIFTVNDHSEPIDLSKLELEWTNGHAILTYKNGKIETSSSFKGRVMMNEQNLRNGDASLILNNVTEVDMLTCIVTYNGETRRDTIILQYKLFVHCPKFIVASPGEESTFTCDFSSGSRGVQIFIDSPAFSIEWNKDSNKHPIARFSKIDEHYMDGLRMSMSKVHHGTFSLTFKSVKPDDYGNYTCKVNYPHYIQGSAVTALYKGHVMVKSANTVEVTTGDNSNFIYTFSLDTQEGSPSIDNSLLSIEFYKDSNKNPLYLFQNGEQQVLDERMRISRNANGDSFILILKNVEFHHNGTYTCTMCYPNYKEGSTSTILLVRSEGIHNETFPRWTFFIVPVLLFLLGTLVVLHFHKRNKKILRMLDGQEFARE